MWKLAAGFEMVEKLCRHVLLEMRTMILRGGEIQ